MKISRRTGQERRIHTFATIQVLTYGARLYLANDWRRVELPEGDRGWALNAARTEAEIVERYTDEWAALYDQEIRVELK